MLVENENARSNERGNNSLFSNDISNRNGEGRRNVNDENNKLIIKDIKKINKYINTDGRFAIRVRYIILLHKWILRDVFDFYRCI